MSLPNVGDLCYVAKVCCPASEELLFKIVRVQAIIGAPCTCHFCGQERLFAEIAVTEPAGGFIRSWLRPFRPLTERETLTESEIAKHPAVVKVVLWDESKVML